MSSTKRWHFEHFVDGRTQHTALSTPRLKNPRHPLMKHYLINLVVLAKKKSTMATDLSFLSAQ